MEITQQINHDLALSGLAVSDLQARPLDMPEKVACGVVSASEGYVIPYFSMIGKVIGFYRIKLFGQDIKYKQIKNTPNHVYFPKTFLATLNASIVKGDRYVIITEGEKKAAKACRSGFPAIAFGGVDSWRNKTLLLPKGTEFNAYSYNKNLIGAKLPSSSIITSDIALEPIAIGFDDFANLIRTKGLTVIIIYDSDETTTLTGMKQEVQKAASELGFELRRRGIPVSRIRQTILPVIDSLGKTGLDDFLTMLDDGPVKLSALIQQTLKKRSAFPNHPNLEEVLSKKLQQSKLGRIETQKLSLSLITDMDGRGIRMSDKESGQLYYFEDQTRKLIKVDMSPQINAGGESSTTPFSKLLYQRYGISLLSDTRLIKWLSTQYTGEEPVENVNPHRVFARPQVFEDVIRVQINDGQYVKITADAKNPIEVFHNGAENILFESGNVDPIDADELLKEFKKRQQEPLEMWWEDVLNEVRLKNHGQSALLFALLYYISPWLHRWRGTQLPAELVIGEAGSGKSTLCELRLQILTGQANLRNAPTDLKDWHASIVNTGGLHVTDNIQLLDKSLKQRLSDEICRLITEPDPHVEMRKYYTNADLMRMRVDAVFCFTGIVQPFPANDLLQRAIIIELDKLAKESSTPEQKVIRYDSSWKQTQINRFGGRTAWVAHHLHVLHSFLALVEKKWNPNYSAKHRLINLEQILVLMAELFQLKSAWIPGFLSSHTDESVVDADWVLEGLKDFCAEVLESYQSCMDLASAVGADKAQAKNRCFNAKDIAAWASQSDEYLECITLVNARRLGRYLQTHKAMVAQVVNLHSMGKHANREMYQIRPSKPKVPE